MRELCVAPVGSEGVHDLAMGDLTDEVVQRWLIFPQTECVQNWGMDAPATRSRRRRAWFLPLALRYIVVTKGFRDGAKMAQRKIGKKGEIGPVRLNGREGNPRTFGLSGLQQRALDAKLGRREWHRRRSMRQIREREREEARRV